MICLLVFLLFGGQQKQPLFDAVKERIAYYESSNGLHKIHVNKKDLSIDCGMWQISSTHFRLNDTTKLGKAFRAIFIRHGVDFKYHARIAAAIMDYALNEDLARELYRQRGIKSWSLWSRVLESMKARKK